MPADCLYWSQSERRYLLACVDDMCHNGGTTLCGLEHGYDFDVQDDDDYDDDWAEGSSDGQSRSAVTDSAPQPDADAIGPV